MFLQTVSAHLGLLDLNSKMYFYPLMTRRAKISVCSSDLKSLVAEDPLMGQSLELRELKGGRSQKISVGSLSTDITDAFSECDISVCSSEREGGAVRRQRSVTSHHLIKLKLFWSY